MHFEHYEPPPSSSSWRGSIMMFVAGTAIGAVAALMMAPASGRDSRAYLRRQSKKVADDVSAQADRLASAVRWGSEQATSAVRETMDSAMSQAKAAYNAARSHRMGEMASSQSTSPNAPHTSPVPARPITSSPS
jgi:gas vesicle protein